MLTPADTPNTTPRHRLRRVLLWTLIPLLGIAAVLAPLAYLTFLREPELTPQDFLDNGGTADGPVVVVAGASSIHGIGSADFVSLLRTGMGEHGYQFINAGINGNTSSDLLDRLDQIIETKPDAVMLLIGTNNVLGAADNTEPALDTYRKDLGTIAHRLATETTAEFAFYSLQPLGEDLDDPQNRLVSRFNAVIADVAAEYDAGYLPLNERLTTIIHAEGGSQPSDFSLLSAALAGTRHYYLGQSWDDIGTANGYTVLVDGVHLNNRGAATAASLAAQWLRDQATHPAP
ncbi:hypothetical protein BAY61_15750 [Prauserella marina]|uniref:Lysophospholipase L1 n=1 Tax=Prauserella marina TaxID=530584 RepID=A0A222VQM3_9PSEU|nr:SGNH/GDSL hydrolase family protein [Prauserella marina]ASR36219.1 hypothetical protein BAY61_15750 [Prauserella marina]PWV76978.1 lysophospholipase L1-like esterase [Prauserella marina]SDD01567.1 Lysophospholipase L1 [Prauserella marina]